MAEVMVERDQLGECMWIYAWATLMFANDIY